MKEHKAERHARGFSCWSQFVAMLFCQLEQAKSLREICNGLMAIEGKLKHLGVDRPPNKSTLAYANEHRPWQLYQTVFGQLLSQCEGLAKGKNKFRFKNKLLTLDSTSIELCATLYDWAKYKRAKGAAKVHLILDNEGHLPHFAVITDGKKSDQAVARTLHFDPGTIVVMDRGYVLYSWWQELTDRGVFFVTRFKKDLKINVIEEREVPKTRGILRDQVVRLSGEQSRNYSMRLRLITKWDEEKQEQIQFLTNHLEFGATRIARIYKDRWQIEIFFKSLKQLLRVKTFVGTSANALHTQIWAALIAMLILKYLQMKSRFEWLLSNLVALLRQQLFVYRDLYRWIDNPFEAPPQLAGIHDGQLNSVSKPMGNWTAQAIPCANITNGGLVSLSNWDSSLPGIKNPPVPETSFPDQQRAGAISNAFNCGFTGFCLTWTAVICNRPYPPGPALLAEAETTDYGAISSRALRFRICRHLWEILSAATEARRRSEAQSALTNRPPGTPATPHTCAMLRGRRNNSLGTCWT